MSRCYLCGTLLNESNRSVEHIIPNAIGGNLKWKSIRELKKLEKL